MKNGELIALLRDRAADAEVVVQFKTEFFHLTPGKISMDRDVINGVECGTRIVIRPIAYESQ